MQRIVFHILVALMTLSPLVVNADEANDQNKKAVLVTGASSGIGNKIAITLANRGFHVYAGARKSIDIKTLSAHPNIEGIRLDVTRDEDIDAAVQHISRAGLGLYGLVNNAGVFIFDPLIEVEESQLDFVMDVNVYGPYRVTKAFAPLIMESRGRITTIGSVAGLFSNALFGPYSMSKFAMEAYTEALAQEMRKFSVAVSIIEPGNFASDIMKNMRGREQRETLFDAEIGRFATFTQADRSHHADPAPVAEAVLAFLGDENPHLRYMVTPSQQETDYALRKALGKVVQLNEANAFRYSREQLHAALDELLDETGS